MMFKYYYALQAIKRWFVMYDIEFDYRVELRKIDGVYQRYKAKITDDHEQRYFWRSVCQLEVQSKTRPRYKIYLLNFIAIFIIPFFLMVYMRKKPIKKRKKSKYLHVVGKHQYKIPNEISNQIHTILPSRHYITGDDIKYCFGMFVENKVFIPELFIRFLYWLKEVRPAIDAFECEYLLQFCEYASTSSIRKHFLNSLNIKMVNVAHGEEVISSRNAFSSFDIYYKWNITPCHIHKAMYMEYSKVYDFNPVEDWKIDKTQKKAPSYIGVLWPAANRKVDLNLFCEQVNKLSASNRIIIRPHPNILYQNNFEKYSKMLNAEVSYESAKDFIDRIDLIVGYNSALLIEAWLSGCSVIYIKHQILNNLQEYHDFYQKMNCIEIENMSEIAKGNN